MPCNLDGSVCQLYFRFFLVELCWCTFHILIVFPLFFKVSGKPLLFSRNEDNSEFASRLPTGVLCRNVSHVPMKYFDTSWHSDFFYVLVRCTKVGERKTIKWTDTLRYHRFLRTLTSRYYSSFFERGALYIIMEYAEGGDLQQLLRRNRSARKHVRYLNRLIFKWNSKKENWSHFEYENHGPIQVSHEFSTMKNVEFSFENMCTRTLRKWISLRQRSAHVSRALE